MREVILTERFHNFIGIKYVIPVGNKEVLVVRIDKLEYSGISVYCLFIPCSFALIRLFYMLITKADTLNNNIQPYYSEVRGSLKINP